MLFETAPISWHNGRLVDREQAAPSVASHSLHLGVGVFDGIMAYWNRDHYYIHCLAAHLDRLSQSAVKIGLGFDWSTADLTAGITALLAELPAKTYYLRPIVYRSVPQLNFSDEMPVDVTVLAVAIVRDSVKPLTCHISAYERVAGRAIPVTQKLCGTYINSYLSRRAAEIQGFNDALLLDSQGQITEASAANLFLIEGDRLVTPALTPNIFPGITRATLLEIAQRLGIEAIERDIYPSELPTFNGAFLAATMMELKPLVTIYPHRYDSVEHPVFRSLLKEFQELTHQ
jgi:branched-chain amino acid aminotransferase